VPRNEVRISNILVSKQNVWTNLSKMLKRIFKIIKKEENRLMTLKEVAALLGKSESTLIYSFPRT
jgi:AraC-like DNA-binding protein